MLSLHSHAARHVTLMSHGRVQEAHLDGGVSQGVELVDCHKRLHVGELWWRDDLRIEHELGHFAAEIGHHMGLALSTPEWLCRGCRATQRKLNKPLGRLS